MLYIELSIVAAFILLNGLLAMSELAVVSSRKARLQAMVERGAVGSRRALALAADPGRFLSTVQIGITLVGILSGAFSGATIGLRLSDWLRGLGLAEDAADAAGVGIVVAGITYASLVAGELVPKQVALRNPERIAARVAPAMTLLARIASPVVWLLDASGRMLLHVLGHKSASESSVTAEEIHTVMAEAESAGLIEAGERRMISAVMRLGERPVRAVMTPLPDVDMIDLTADDETIRRTLAGTIHSRLPVHDGSPDEMLGIIQARDLLGAFMRGETPDLRAHVRPAPVVPDTVDTLDVIDTIKGSQVHLGLVHDEFGHFRGVVTNADILESIVGAFRTEGSATEPDFVERGDGSWLVSGMVPVDDLTERLAMPVPEADRGYHTVAGFVLDQLGHLPAVGERFEAHGWRFEVVDLDGARIDKVLATRIALPRRSAPAR